MSVLMFVCNIVDKLTIQYKNEVWSGLLQHCLLCRNASFLYQSDLVEPDPVITTSQNIAATELGHMAM